MNPMRPSIVPARNLTRGLVDRLASQIENGNFALGQRLPSEQAIVAATGVSRTVVREALAALRARGLVVSRQGLGVFVADRQPPRSFSILPADNSLDDVLRLLELRMGIETEAACLAATRRSDADLDDLRRRLGRIEAAQHDADQGAEEDLAFHRAILDATGNPYFARVFDVFGCVLIPRQRYRLGGMGSEELNTYFRRLRREHEAIVHAIEKRDPAAAQRAIRRHLGRSLQFYREARDAALHLGSRAK